MNLIRNVSSQLALLWRCQNWIVSWWLQSFGAQCVAVHHNLFIGRLALSVVNSFTPCRCVAVSLVMYRVYESVVETSTQVHHGILSWIIRNVSDWCGCVLESWRSIGDP